MTGHSFQYHHRDFEEIHLKGINISKTWKTDPQATGDFSSHEKVFLLNFPHLSDY